MKRFFQIFLFLLGLPTIIFFCVMSIPVLMFALPAVVFGNPFNLFYVIWWGIGAYGIWSGIRAAIAYGKPDYILEYRYRIGIVLGIVAFLPVMPLAFSRQIGFGPVSSFIIRLAFLGLFPASILLLLSFKKFQNDPENPSHADADPDPDSNPKLPIQGPPWDQ